MVLQFRFSIICMSWSVYLVTVDQFKVAITEVSLKRRDNESSVMTKSCTMLTNMWLLNKAGLLMYFFIGGWGKYNNFSKTQNWGLLQEGWT